nr:MAG TPA: hypothetical protein [Caudoviricetes sp.]
MLIFSNTLCHSLNILYFFPYFFSYLPKNFPNLFKP